jgi:hypothetical protein
MELPVSSLRGIQISSKSAILVDGVFSGIIDEAKYTITNAGEALELAGYDLKGLLKQRQIVPTDYTSTDGTAGYDARTGPSETIMKGFIDANLASPPQSARVLQNFFIATDQARGITDDKYMARLDILSDVVSKIAEDAQLGWRVSPVIEEGNPFGYIFDCVDGLDRTAGQTYRPPAIFSIERRNVTSMEYVDSLQGYFNAFYTTRAGAKFEDEALTLLYWRDGEEQPTGIDRFEKSLTVSMSNVPVGEEYTEMRRQALIQARQYERLISFTAEISQSRMQYGIDFALGDMVTVRRPQWGVTMDTRIISITREWNSSGYSVKATFGTSVPNIIKRLQRSIKELS